MNFKQSIKYFPDNFKSFFVNDWLSDVNDW
jgi:hypothetical protein